MRSKNGLEKARGGDPISCGGLRGVKPEEEGAAGFGSDLRSTGAGADRDACAKGARGGFHGDGTAAIADGVARKRVPGPFRGDGDDIEGASVCAERGAKYSGDGAAAIDDGGFRVRGAEFCGGDCKTPAIREIDNRGYSKGAAAF